MGQIVTSDIVKNLLPGLKTTFMQGWTAQNANLPYKGLVTEVPSTLPSENYAWLGQVPAVRQWTDERIPKGLSEFSYSIKNLKWENSIKIDAEVLEDEQYGQVKMRVGQLPGAIARHQNKLVMSQFTLGDSTVCYDGANFFSASHSEGNSGTQTNLLTSSPLNAANYQAARNLFASFKDDQGELVGAHGTILMVPRALEGTARAILNSDFVSDGAGAATTVTNIWKGSAKLVVNDYLSSATAWYLLDDEEYIMPVVFQNRVPVSLKMLMGDSDSDSVFMRDAFYVGTRARYNVGYGDWRTAVKSA